jgi:hypothetical protein
MTAPIFMQFPRVLGASVGVQGTSILFVDNCATHLQDNVWNVKVLYCTPNCTCAIPSM